MSLAISTPLQLQSRNERPRSSTASQDSYRSRSRAIGYTTSDAIASSSPRPSQTSTRVVHTARDPALATSRAGDLGARACLARCRRKRAARCAASGSWIRTGTGSRSASRVDLTGLSGVGRRSTVRRLALADGTATGQTVRRSRSRDPLSPSDTGALAGELR